MPTFHRSLDGGTTWRVVTPKQFRTQCAASAVAEPSGGLLAYIIDATYSHGAEPGLYESDNSSWTHFHAVDSSPSLHGANSSPNDGGSLLAATTDGQGGQTLFLSYGGYLGSEPVGDFVSTDGGRTWTATDYR